MSLTLNLKECGKVTIQWNKSCGDFMYPPRGFSLDIKVPQKISTNINLSPLKSDSFANENSKFFLKLLIYRTCS